jgi:ribosomal protein S1
MGYGAFVELEPGVEGLVHVSNMRPCDIVRVGDRLTCRVLAVDPQRRRIALGLKQASDDPREGDGPARQRPGEVEAGQ